MWSAYTFNHPRANRSIIVKAFSEKGAWKKMRKIVIFLMYGRWALIYDRLTVDRIMRDVICEKL